MAADDDGAYPVAPEVRYFAPMHKVMEICVPIFIAGKIEGLAASAEMLAKRVASMEETIASLKASRAATVEDKVSTVVVRFEDVILTASFGVPCISSVQPSRRRLWHVL